MLQTGEVGAGCPQLPRRCDSAALMGALVGGALRLQMAPNLFASLRLPYVVPESEVRGEKAGFFRLPAGTKPLHPRVLVTSGPGWSPWWLEFEL